MAVIWLISTNFSAAWVEVAAQLSLSSKQYSLSKTNHNPTRKAHKCFLLINSKLSQFLQFSIVSRIYLVNITLEYPCHKGSWVFLAVCISETSLPDSRIGLTPTERASVPARSATDGHELLRPTHRKKEDINLHKVMIMMNAVRGHLTKKGKKVSCNTRGETFFPGKENTFVRAQKEKKIWRTQILATWWQFVMVHHDKSRLSIFV